MPAKEEGREKKDVPNDGRNDHSPTECVSCLYEAFPDVAHNPTSHVFYLAKTGAYTNRC